MGKSNQKITITFSLFCQSHCEITFLLAAGTWIEFKPPFSSSIFLVMDQDSNRSWSVISKATIPRCRPPFLPPRERAAEKDFISSGTN